MYKIIFNLRFVCQSYIVDFVNKTDFDNKLKDVEPNRNELNETKTLKKNKEN